MKRMENLSEKRVIWFFANENHEIVAETEEMGYLEEERAIDILSVKAGRGRYILGYKTAFGEICFYDVFRQIV